ncbi:efflux RND transporter permease subunit [Bacillus smithii]|uniref:efflux RND transporter permease subunit n=1 Tax=Bacillus smithii TaxID=1479 RepID=UPI00065E56CF|nr:efflux RND transporter permease subunit [Bacillus smithii]AKP48713.1 RND multidrug efflux transporterAcriflavin resistance protein [Bacillus smithii]
MNKIIHFVLKNKLAVWLMTIIVTVAGLYAGLTMKLETIPNINTPILTVTTAYPGATPEEVADKVTKPIEQALQNLDGVNVVSSSSFANASSVQVEYTYEKNMDDAKREAEQALSDVQLPDGVKKPDIKKLSINEIPILSLSLSSDKESLSQLTKKVQEDIVPKLERIDGVANVQISGQQVDQVQIDFNQEKLKKYGLDEESVQNFIKGSNVSLPLGLYTFRNSEKSVKVDGNISTIKDLKNMEIPIGLSAGASVGAGQSSQVQPSSSQSGLQGAGQQSTAVRGPQQGNVSSAGIPTVKLSDIADIKLVGKAESFSSTNGKESIGLEIVKAADANTVDVANAVKDKMNEIKGKNKDLHVITAMDQAKPIEESVHTMLNKAVFGAVFAVLIILLFLRNIKSTLIAVISIPLSLVISLFVLKQMNITLNMMTLGAMTVAIGRVVDDSIVVIENIYRRMSLKEEILKGKELIREATKEMFIPIMSSTIVTIAVFLPLALVKGMIGELFLPFALAIVFSLLASLLVAITIVPMMASILFKKGIHRPEQLKSGQPNKLSSFYKRVLNWVLNHKFISSAAAILLLIGSLCLIPAIGVSFLPNMGDKMVVATYTPAPGETFADVKKVSLKAEDYLRGRKGAEIVQFSVGSDNPMNPGQSNSAIFFVQYDKDTKNFDKEPDRVIKHLQTLGGKGEWSTQDFSASAGNNEVTVYVYGNDMKEITPVVDQIEKKMKEQGDFKDVEASTAKTYDEYVLAVNQQKLSQLGLTASQIAMALNQQSDQPALTTVKEKGQELNVYVENNKKNYQSVQDLTNQTVQSPLGMDVPIKQLVNVKEGKTSDTVTRRDGRYSVQVSGKVKEDDISKASMNLQKRLDQIHHPSSVDISMGGVTEDVKDSFTKLGLAMAAAIAIVYLVLVITFGQGWAPFVILFSLPFAIIGALVALFIAGQTISVSTMIGALMLIGIVVTNAIVLIDRVIHKEREGLSTREALLEAGATRIRPILMTAIATIGALIPLAIGMEGSGLISKDLGVTVIGGLTSSTLLTLLIVPIVYEWMSKLRRKRFFKRKKSVTSEQIDHA